MVNYPDPPPGLPRLVLIGSGWASFYIAEKIDYSKYAVTMISPRRTSAYTPLLASAAVGLFNFYLAEEQVRSKSRKALRFLKANVSDINFDKKACTCTPAFDEDPKLSSQEFEVEYDHLVIAPGCEPNTFNIPGVAEHGIFIKNVSDAMRVRKKLFDLLEIASLPHIPAERAKELLHVAIVGGGPTGIELCAEIGDLAQHELKDLYPQVADYVRISIYDVAPNILGAYDRSLHEYATKQLTKRDISVRTNTIIERVDEQALHIKTEGRVPYGMLLWATGNKNVPLIDEIASSVHMPEKGLKRILTDQHLRVYKRVSGSDHEFNALHENVYALGDAADIFLPYLSESATSKNPFSLPTTAEAAVQKAKYLVEQFNSVHDLMSEPFSRPFMFQEKQMVSYIGSHDGVITGLKNKTLKAPSSSEAGESEGNKEGWTGQAAWLAWRRGALYWNRSWRSRIAIVISWTLNAIFGKEIAKL